jgi:signal transduction histidine kinase
MRTPLNAAILGLKLMCQDVGQSENVQDQERFETLNDINLACTAAVDILNDILCFDKMENGLLKLHAEFVPVMSFIQETMKMFAGQAAERGVTMTLKTDSFQSDIEALNDEDVVFMDKFKMDQVLRNLISNALKFTSRRGSVMVAARFVPEVSRTNMLMRKTLIPTLRQPLVSYFLHIYFFPNENPNIL